MKGRNAPKKVRNHSCNGFFLILTTNLSAKVELALKWYKTLYFQLVVFKYKIFSTLLVSNNIFINRNWTSYWYAT